MSSELHKYIKKSIERKNDLINAEVINFPNDKTAEDLKNFTEKKMDYWKINNKGNDDQLRAIIGICFMFGTLIVVGLYSNFL
tara:strand:+ start:383 stop:628 length:246 start_codon:yes stop_codon:yes gene_type:complete